MPLTAADAHPASGGRLLFAPPQTDVRVWLLRLTDLDRARREALMAPFPDLLPEAPPERRLAHALVRHWLAELLDCAPAEISLSSDDGGKPRLAGPGPAFNLSHSRHWLALAWSREQLQVGVDIEDIGRGQAFEALAQRYFHPAEIEAWQAAAGAAGERQWLHSWTRKEAVLKAHGLGLRLRLATLDTTGSPVQHPELGRWSVFSEDLSDAVLSVSLPAP